MTDASTTWRITVPEHWVVWRPGVPDLEALHAAATTTRRAGLALTQGVGVIEKELETAPGDVRQVGVADLSLMAHSFTVTGDAGAER